MLILKYIYFKRHQLQARQEIVFPKNQSGRTVRG